VGTSRSWRLRLGVGGAAAAVLSVLTAQTAHFGAAEPAPSGPESPYVVTFDPGTSAGEQRESRHDVEDAGGEVHRIYSHAVRGFAADLPPETVKELRADPDVRSVAPDVPVQAAGGVQNPAPWNLDRIDQRSQSTDGSFHYDGDGSGITVYVVDTGIRGDHVEFGGRVDNAHGFTAINDGNGDNDCDGLPGTNHGGHGTHVAGIVGSNTWGVAKGVRLVPVRVLDCKGEGNSSGVVAGLDWVIANHVPGKSVVNMSLGGQASTAVDDAVQATVDAGIPVVVAAGNETVDACTESPSGAPNAITVGAVNSSDQKPGFSNFGSCVDVFAPGVAIVSTFNSSTTALAQADGTSQASPHVAGVVATLLQGAPGASPAALRATLGSLFTTGVLGNIGANSPNALLYAPPKLRLAGVGTATIAPFVAALGADSNAIAVAGEQQVDAFATSGSTPIDVQDPATLPGCSIARPTSQAQSRSALLASLAAGNGCLRFAEAESLDLSAASQPLVYVPFARDNVTYAISNTSNLLPNRTLSSLQALFRCQNAGVSPMLPTVGSGLREYWISQMYTDGVVPSCVQNGVDEFGQPIQPNAGGQVNDSEIVPMSVAQWTTQAAGVLSESRGRTRIGQINSQNPFGFVFPLQRDLYVVIPKSTLTGSGLDDVRTREVFVGSGSLVCAAVPGPVGLRYGFTPHPSCGSTSLQTP
jgi:subtilisin family serine protease